MKGKVFIALAFFLGSAAMSSASDVIVTNQTEKIEAKVLEVTPKEVKFKKTANLEGPTYTMYVADIQEIVYENGTVDKFGVSSKDTVDKKNVQPVLPPIFTPTKSDTVALQTNVSADILGYKSLNGERLSDEEYAQYLKDRCMPAYESFAKGRRLWRAGWTLFIAGQAVRLSGIICCIAYQNRDFSDELIDGYYRSNKEDHKEYLRDYGVTAIVFGSAACITSIPFIIKGGIKRGRSIAIYNDQCVEQSPKAYLNLNVNTNGLGLALNF